MNKSIRLLGILSLFGILLNTGCSIFPEAQPDIPVSYFDIGFPAKIEGLDKSKQIKVQDAKTIDPYNDRMIFRASDTHIQIDDYNRWASTPNEMFKKYFIMAFAQDEASKLQQVSDNKYNLFITVMCLEANLKSNEIKLTLFIEIKKFMNGDIAYTDYLTDSCKVDKMSAESFASAVKVMTDKMLVSLAKNISQIKSEK